MKHLRNHKSQSYFNQAVFNKSINIITTAKNSQKNVLKFHSVLIFSLNLKLIKKILPSS